MFRGTLIAIGICLLLLAPIDISAQGCAMCKAVVESEQNFGGAQAVGRGLNNGIMYLMATPYILMFLFFRKRIVAFVKEFARAQG